VENQRQRRNFESSQRRGEKKTKQTTLSVEQGNELYSRLIISSMQAIREWSEIKYRKEKKLEFYI
jgi:hypothetical protein